MGKIRNHYTAHRPAWLAAVLALCCAAAVGLLWLAEVRPNTGKSRSSYLSDDYSAMSAAIEPGQSATQTFPYDEDLLAVGFVFGTEGGQPAGTLALTLADADTGEVLARSTGEMANIVAGQYIALGLDTPVAGTAGRRYLVTLTPEYAGDGRLCMGQSTGATLWDDVCTVNGERQDATFALLVTYRQIGGFLNRYFLLVGVAACLLVFLGVRAALAKKMALHRLVFCLVVGFGLLYSFVLPPYAAPDEKYHINQSFTLACRWANALSSDEWRMGAVPIDTSYRREHDVNAILQDENTTVFSWQALADDLFTLTPDSFDSHVELAELQTDRNPISYLPSAAVVFLCFLLHLGFVPTLMLGRLANLLLFAALAALAVRWAPFGRRVFAAAALLPMTLHLAASFSRDAMLLGLAFAFTALCMQAVFGGREGAVLPPRIWAPLAAFGLLLAPIKVVYLPLAALFLLVPGRRLGRRPALKKAGYLAGCLALALALNSTMLSGVLAAGGGAETAQTASEAVSGAADETVSGAAASAAPTAARPAAKAAPGPEETAAPETEGGETETQAWLDAMPEALYEKTADAFVRRLYYCAELRDDEPDSEVAFWVTALENGDVGAAELGQSFLFSPEAMAEDRFTDDEFLTAVTLIYLDRDILKTDEADYHRALLVETGRVLCFKNTYSTGEAQALFAEIGIPVGTEDASRYPLSRADLAAEVEAAQAVRASQSTSTAEDQICYTPGYILTHIPATVLLLVRSAVENTDELLATLVGGTLSYNSLSLAWGWVVALYLLLGFAMLPARDELDDLRLPQGRYRAACALAAAGCCLLALGGCITWTPTYYQTVYGFQGRYLLPVLPLLALCLQPRRVHVADEGEAAAFLTAGLCLVNAGVLVNAMLAVIAR